MYLSCELAHKRILGLETFWNESLWVEIKVNKGSYLIGLFYSPLAADPIFFDALNKNIKKALDITSDIKNIEKALDITSDNIILRI